MPESRFMHLYVSDDPRSVIHFFSRTLLAIVSWAIFSRPEIWGLCPFALKCPADVVFLFFFFFLCLPDGHSLAQFLPRLANVHAVALWADDYIDQWDVSHVNLSLICFNPLFVRICVMFFAIGQVRHLLLSGGTCVFHWEHPVRWCCFAHHRPEYLACFSAFGSCALRRGGAVEHSSRLASLCSTGKYCRSIRPRSGSRLFQEQTKGMRSFVTLLLFCSRGTPAVRSNCSWMATSLSPLSKRKPSVPPLDRCQQVFLVFVTSFHALLHSQSLSYTNVITLPRVTCNLFVTLVLVACVESYYTRRGSVWYIVCEWLFVSSKERERERERETLVTSIDIKLKSRVIMHNNQLIPKTIGNTKRDCAWGCARG